MRRLPFVLLGLFILAGALGAEPATQRARSLGINLVPDPLKPIDFQLPDLAGARVRLSALTGKIVLLNFWATWCPACRAEMPSMQKVYQALRAEGLEILAVNLGEDGKTVRAFAKQQGLGFPIALDSDGSVGTQYGAHALPTTLLLDRHGLIFAWAVGSREWDSPEMLALLRAILKDGIAPDKPTPWQRRK